MRRYGARGHLALAVMCAVLALAGCTSNPNAPVNRTFPIRQMDRFFDNAGRLPAATPDYRHKPGYAPAYPPYQ